MPIGLHINLTEGDALLKTHRTLTDNNNKFYPKMIFISKAVKGEFHPEEIRQEVTAQLEKFRKVFQMEPNHIDGHQHVQVMPTVAAIVADVLQQTTLSTIRIPHQITSNCVSPVAPGLNKSCPNNKSKKR